MSGPGKPRTQRRTARAEPLFGADAREERRDKERREQQADSRPKGDVPANEQRRASHDDERHHERDQRRVGEEGAGKIRFV
jgi:hypothetical protein